uniref:Uncharacterized protein n=1 Tax=Glycine max TaxID=3847 RepID=A0A0R0ISS5_SOYBN
MRSYGKDIIEHGYYIPLDYQLNEVPITSWTDTQRQRFLLNSKSQNVLCALSKEEYVKEKCNKIILLTRKYELFTMDDGEDIQAMFGCFQTILNELRCLKKTFDNYDNIEKTLRSLSRKWRSLVTILRIVKNLDSMSIVELIGTLKKAKAFSTCKESSFRPASKSSSKAINSDTSYDKESDNESLDEDDQFAFISRKIRNIWKKMSGSD